MGREKTSRRRIEKAWEVSQRRKGKNPKTNKTRKQL
jgi:hypothetical protein